MFTQCPQCQTTFRVSATLLKAARGRVRCGRCAHVFDALAFLIEEQAPADDRDELEGLAARDDADDARSAGDPQSAGEPQNAVAADGTETAADTADDDRDDDLPYDPERFDTGEIPDSALEFSAEDLSEVFVPAKSTAVARPPHLNPASGSTPAPASDENDPDEIDPDEDTAEHEILDIDVQSSEGSEYITLEGDSVVLSDEDPGVAPESFGLAGSGDGSQDEPLDDELQDVSQDELQDELQDGPPEQAQAADGAATADPPLTKSHEQPRSVQAIDNEVQREIEAAFAADPTTRAEFTLPSGRRLAIGQDGVSHTHVDPALEQLTRTDANERRGLLKWSIASAALAVLLCVQVVHHNRQSLVRSAVIGPALGAIYAGLGSELTPQWNVRAYELRQFGAAAESGASGTLRVRASLLNGAQHAQPYPVLRLTLQDRFGGRVGLRDVEPRDYLPGAPSGNALIGAGQRVDASIAIVDPGEDAVGFEIDVCLRAPADSLTCANDVPANAG